MSNTESPFRTDMAVYMVRNAPKPKGGPLSAIRGRKYAVFPLFPAEERITGTKCPKRDSVILRLGAETFRLDGLAFEKAVADSPHINGAEITKDPDTELLSIQLYSHYDGDDEDARRQWVEKFVSNLIVQLGMACVLGLKPKSARRAQPERGTNGKLNGIPLVPESPEV